MVSSSAGLGLSILLNDHFPFLVVLNNRKNRSIGNCLSKFNDKTFNIYMPPLASGHLKNVVSGVRKNPVKYFASGVHQEYGYWVRNIYTKY